jgi:hypothetical protein
VRYVPFQVAQLLDHKTNYKEPEFLPTKFYICWDCENIWGYGLTINLQIIYFL